MRIISDCARAEVVPSDGEFPIQAGLFCWECENSLSEDEAVAVEIEFGGLELRVPMCSVCAPSRPRSELQARLASLSPREREVQVLLAKGMNTRQVADALGIGTSCARLHAKRILHKLTCLEVLPPYTDGRTRKGYKPLWTEQDDLLVLQEYGITPTPQLAEQLGRSERAVQWRAGVGLGITLTSNWYRYDWQGEAGRQAA